MAHPRSDSDVVCASGACKMSWKVVSAETPKQSKTANGICVGSVDPRQMRRMTSENTA